MTQLLEKLRAEEHADAVAMATARKKLIGILRENVGQELKGKALESAVELAKEAGVNSGEVAGMISAIECHHSISRQLEPGEAQAQAAQNAESAVRRFERETSEIEQKAFEQANVAEIMRTDFDSARRKQAEISSRVIDDRKPSLSRLITAAQEARAQVPANLSVLRSQLAVLVREHTELFADGGVH
jgi:hypothetical protein